MKTLILFLLIFLNFAFIRESKGQNKIDSLKNEISATVNKQRKLDLLFRLIKNTLNSKNATTLKYIRQAENLSNDLKDSSNFSYLYYYYGKYESFAGNYKKAMEYYLKSINISEKKKQEMIFKKALNNLAVLNMRTKNFDKGIESFKQLLSWAKEKNDDNDIIYYSLNLAMAFGEKGDFKKSEQYLLKVFQSSIKNKFYKAVAANNLSFIYNNTNKYKKAERFAKEAIKQIDNQTDIGFRIEALTNLSNALRREGKYYKAEKIIKDIIELARKNNFKRKMNNAIGNLALNYEALGNYKNALKFYKDFSERKDSLLNETTEKQINELQIKYETEKKDREITKKNAALEVKNIVITYSIIGVVFFMIFSIVIFVFYTHKKTAYRELVRKNLALIKSEDKILSQKRDLDIIKKDKYESSSLSEDKKNEIGEKIDELMNDEKIYLQSDLTLGKFAQRLNINSKYLSQVIHEIYNTNFSDFINQLRIKEAARLLSDKSYKHFSIEGISELVGFHTKSSFNNSFKKNIGVTPSFFVSALQSITDA